ncbi:MAG: hypothetical protein A3K60_08590 [Euryarchaeota archaeon RBG_19FT_COMBO_56_21]|nr:MAG: hypothetical protein A3K60_08590 [Euryarchaeota archaeon RBG_19FT_COMBO_56_21]
MLTLVSDAAMTRWQAGGTRMPKPKKGTEYVCDVCGTTLLVTEDGIGILDDVVCCEKPMKTRTKKSKKKAKPKRKTK